MQKGISPLIATILLIAFVIAVGGILSGWLISFSKEKTDEAKTKGEAEIKCSYSALRIMDADWNSTETKLSLIIENRGTEDITDFRMVVIYNNNTAMTFKVTPSTTLSPGDIEVFYNSSISDCNKIDQVIFFSNTCPVDARDKVLGSNIDGCA